MFQKNFLPSHLLGACLLLTTACSQAEGESRPAVLNALEAQGLSVMQEFEAGKELRAFAAVAGDQPIAVYVAGDGTAIVGTRLDARGNRLDDEKLQELAAKPMQERAWASLESSVWVLDGKANAPRVIYTFSDPNCPYCNRFWEATRPWVDAGKVQLRHVLVGIIREDSPTKAAAILGAADRSAALLENERKFDRGGIAPAGSVPAQVRQILEDNQALMLSMGFRGTPGIVVRDETGSLKKFNGMPRPDTLANVLGPR
ncbi:TPA: thiol:disulfide interchange protein DsbG [Stenotrophomonas maltophilia]|jgi:thiol:disulfide interchange protein DsbG|uniref:thiol:disulfide interchange protein DsbG n=1 Tax=Burkholderia sp. LMG 13014 TaxID=2709306 RepID=UPI001965F0C0|nr:thiol:disulfide interchange protein DsbG [Burkholderia sp. LMG 13014]HDS1367956.1 thiol:disulfide interchange protein DsbG [Stenotrophomonas maltophilia]HEJ3239993.1 thiol:disulfide interchange protein DsbG [Pseudomonas aeruginosa]HDS1372570.1 thiol:disulfide interchange protein DsbG [Stenotrophomonas maltophilia]HDS1376495.1 thiol:disulfide interchange protein DsbG [Stenotrophomonas maltophilia]HDS1381349.1 thiol:disulfide interchange protein DsbG [Stenotrophomonas maltophilia]